MLGADYPYSSGDLRSLKGSIREDLQALDNSANDPLFENEDRIDFTG